MLANYQHENISAVYWNTGRQCCLWCHITRQELVIPRDKRGLKPARTLATLHADLQRFETAEIRDAKCYNNVIAPPLFEVPVDQVIYMNASAAVIT